MDVLEEKAKEVLKESFDRKDINYIDGKLKEKFPDKKIPTWMKRYIFALVYQKHTQTELADLLQLSRGTIWKYVDDDIKGFIDELKNQQVQQYEQKLYNLVEKSINTLEEIVDSADSDATRLRAAESVLKQYKLLSEKSEVELSGSITMPTINIISEVE